MRSKPDFWKGVDRICWICVFMEKFIQVDSLEDAPLILSGMASIVNAPSFASARQAIFNMRLLSLKYVTQKSLHQAIAIYNNFHYCNKSQGAYKIAPETLQFQRTDPLEDPLIAKAVKILSQPLVQQLYSATFANPRQLMTVALGEEKTALRLPIGPISAPLVQSRTHSLDRLPKGKIRIPLSELHELAVSMDALEENYPEKRQGNWEKRFQHFALMVPETGEGLREEKAITLEGIKHLIGLPGAGKTTVLVLIAMWLGRRGYKAMFIFPSIEVARQYMAELAFHGVKVGMLVGQSDETRRRHADNVAEAIASSTVAANAASGGNGGFAYTLEEAEVFGMNCVLPAFSTADTSMWGFGYAPCKEILQSRGKEGKQKNYLCPVWTMCGRNKAPRDLLDADIWVGHVFSMDTEVPPHAIREQIRYFELIARTFDVVVFDEADMVQSNLDAYGAATLQLSGAENSIHSVIQEQIHNRFARGENYRLLDREVELYSRDLSEFGDHNTSLVTAVQNLSSSRIQNRYKDQMLTVSRIIGDLLDGLEKNFSWRDRLDSEEVKQGFSKNRALREFWEIAAYRAFYDRTGMETPDWPKADLCARTLGIARTDLEEKLQHLIHHFRRYLAENLIERRDKIVREIADLFLTLCFCDRSGSSQPIKPPPNADEVITLLVCITFVILGYQRIVPRTRTMVAEGLIREPIIQSTASEELRKIIPENILGSFSGVKYSFKSAQTTRIQARNVELSYITFVGAPRLLMHRFHRLFEAEGQPRGPATLMTSATSFLEASPAYHINSGPDYLLKPTQVEHDTKRSFYYFKWIPDSENRSEPLKYSGAGELRNRNLEKMVEFLVRKGTVKSEIYKAIRNFDVQNEIYRKAALIVNSYEQARTLKKYLNDYHPEVGKRTKAVVRSLKSGEQASDFVTTAQCEALGDDETCDILIFPMLAIGRGVNIVFTKGPRKLDAAIGTIYFLTRPHPTTDDMQLLYSLAGRATQEFDSKVFTESEDFSDITKAWQQSRKNIWASAGRLLREPLMASRLGEDLFKSFAANQMVGILQTIGRGMRNGCPVQVYFVDSAWAYQSTKNQPDSGRDSLLVQMRIILEECVNHPDPVTRQIYQELYGAFLDPLRRIEGVVYPANLRSSVDLADEEDGFDEFSYLLDM